MYIYSKQFQVGLLQLSLSGVGEYFLSFFNINNSDKANQP